MSTVLQNQICLVNFISQRTKIKLSCLECCYFQAPDRNYKMKTSRVLKQILKKVISVVYVISK